MSAYFFPPRSQAAHDPQRSEIQNASGGLEGSVLTLDLERSIYLFPNPSSIPPSPSGSSLSSVPTDFTISSPGGSTSRERTISHTTDGSGSDYAVIQSHARRRGESTSSYTVSSWQNSPLAPSPFSADVNSNVAMWQGVAEFEEEQADLTSRLEAEVERRSRWEIAPRSNTIQSSSTSAHHVLRFRTQVLDSHVEGYQRIRTESDISFKSLSSYRSSTSFGGPPHPHPRLRVPLLSFIASLFRLDLDDPALRLLTTSSSDSVLFPGQGSLVGIHDTATSQTAIFHVDSPDADESEDEEAHGILRLLTLSDDSHSAIQSLKNGLEVMSAVPAIFTVPSVGTLFGLSQVVGKLWKRGFEAVYQLQGHAPL